MNLDSIHQEYAHAVQNTTELFYGALEEIKANRDLDADERAREAWAAHAAAREALGRAAALRNEALAGRQDALERKLFRGPNALSNEAGHANYTRALEQVAAADDATLEHMGKLAQKTRNGALSRAVFAEAHERGMGELVSRYLSGHDEDSEVYEELSSIPDEAARDQALDNVAQAIPESTTAQVTPRAHIADTQEPAARPLAG
jgi:hypothetical protein